MYRVLYRKWRPQTFEEVYGQPHITATLKNELVSGRVAHAYLFTGTRGTGKTTCAKILSKAVNCLSPHDGDPCNECEICRGIDNGSVLDVIEIDAASNNGVDNIRDLRDEANFTPVKAKYRVYIIDEVHMLSTGAFNALLKILEEPPDYAVFLLLTTSAEKLLPTIRSRAVQLQLSPLTPGEALPELRRRFPDESEQNLSSALEQAEGYLGPACEALKDGLFSEPALGLANGFAARDTLALLQALVPMEKYKREQVLPVLEQTRKLLSMALRARAGERAAFGPVQALLRGRTGAELLQAAELLQQAADDLNGNVGVGAVIGGLCVSLR